MPFVNVRVVKGALDDDKKRELQAKLTDVLVEVEGGGNESFRPFVWVHIEETDAQNWALGGINALDMMNRDS